jgi:hypothetical protein
MNVIIFIIRVLKLLFMNRCRILVFLCALLILAVPVSANLHKIAAGAPVFIGERDLDLSSPMNGHSVIAWWANGTDTSATPDKTLTISTDEMAKFSISPQIFTGYTGKWYTYDKAPNVFVFDVMEPQIDLKIWDVNNNRDVTGQSVPMSTKITYRIDTNLYLARKYVSRPDYNPTDLFFTVKVTNPKGIPLSQIYTGNIGGKDTQILSVETNPVITASPFYWGAGEDWDRNARSTDGSIIYSAGTYTFNVTQNLNSMIDSYSTSDPAARIGKVTSGDKTITFIEDVRTNMPTVAPQQTTAALTMVTQQPTSPPVTPAKTVIGTTTKPTSKPTYQPLPEWLSMLGVGIVALVFISRRNR